MSARITPPIFPFRPADDSSKFLAKDLIIAYPMLEKDSSKLKNYGSLGSALDLNLTNPVFSRNDGIATMDFYAGSTANKTGLNLMLPEYWSFAYWVKVDDVPTSEELNIFTFRGASEGHLRAWMDQQGIWGWQKFSTADGYSIIPASNFPTSRLMLVVGVFGHVNLPPAQLFTNQGFTTQPVQPFSYAVYNDGKGNPARQVGSFYLGSDPTGTEPLKGSLGPVYIWERAISNSEIWQLWKDPYAPFRRSLEQNIVPSAMISFSDFSLEGIGKSTHSKPLFQDNNALTIYVDDYMEYPNTPVDYIVVPLTGNVPSVEINIEHSIGYVELLSDSLQNLSGVIPRIDIEIEDNISYVAQPTDYMEADAPYSLITINISDDLSYTDVPSDTFIPEDSYTITTDVIIINESISYVDLPDDTLSGTTV